MASSTSALTRVLGPPEGRAIRLGLIAVVLVVLTVATSLLNVNLVSVTVFGLQTGVVYALVAVGLALVYKSTRVLNFAQGEIGTVAAFVVFMGLARAPDGGGRADATLEPGYPFLEILGWTLLAVVIGATLAVVINVGVVSRLANAAPVTTLVATIGVALLLVGSEVLYFQALPRSYPKFVSGNPPGVNLFGLCLSQKDDAGNCLGTASDLTLGGTIIDYQFVATAVVLVLVAVGLATFFRTPAGVALLATSQEPFAAQLQGVSIRAMSALAWGTAGAFGALAGVLGGGVSEGIAPGFMTSRFLIPAIVAAVLGGITSVPGAAVGALILGIVQAFANELVLTQGWRVPGPPTLAMFAVLLLVLLFRPRGLFGKEA